LQSNLSTSLEGIDTQTTISFSFMSIR